MANKCVVHRDSAISTKSKENILVADLLRVMRNVSTKCTNEERRTKIQEFIMRMQYSGYTKRERVSVYLRAKKKYNEILKKNDEGIQPLYRSKSWNIKERKEVKQSKVRNWFQNDGSEAVFFVEATPKGKLAEACKREFKQAGLKIKVVEKTGATVKKSLVKSDPFKVNSCTLSTCQVCALGNGINCKTREVVYRIACTGTNKNNEQCTKIEYEGETARSISERFGEHTYYLSHQNERIRKKSILYEHIKKEHDSEVPSVKLEILARCPGDPSLRQAIEAVCIRENKPVLNGKEEWTNQPKKRKDNK